MKLPFYVKASLLLIGLYTLISMLYVAEGIILPLIFATIFAISLSPPVNFLVKKNFNRALAISIVLVMAFLFIGGIIALLSTQASLLKNAYPTLVAKFQVLFQQTIIWISSHFNISVKNINAWLETTNGELMNNSTSAIGMTLSTMGGVLSIVFLIPVYIFMILFYQSHLLEFIHRLFGGEHDETVSDLLIKIKTIIQSYLVGLFLEFAIVGALNSVCLMILGIEYALLFGLIGALLNVIPYVGGIIAVGLFMIIALVTKTPIYALYVFILYGIIQFIDNHYIVPKVIGSKVKLNALICLIAVISGAALWGIPGMFLSIPITAIVKNIFDNVETLKPWGFLLGDTTPPIKFYINFKEFSKNLPQVMPPFRKR